MESNTQTKIRTIDDIGIIEISGEVTSFSEEVLERAYEQLTKKSIAKIAFNFEGVSYINSAGMAIIISILTKSRDRGQALSCWGLSEHFRKIFDMVGITKYISNHNSEDEALRGLA